MNCSGTVRLNPVGAIFITVVLILIVYFNFGDKNESVFTYKTVSLKALLVASIEIAKRGGAEVKAIRELADIGEKSKGKTLEGANNPVTDGDMKSHLAMYYGLKKTFEGLNIISEEHDSAKFDLSTVKAASIEDDVIDEDVPDSDDIILPIEEIDVWIDPLDATQEYTENLRQYVTTMVCIAVRGKPTIGVIFKPFSDEMFWAWWGPNHVSPTLQAKKAVSASKTKIIVSRSHSGKVEAVAKKAFGPEVQVTPAGGAGFKVVEVTSGREDAYVHVTLIKKWDLCAGNAILNALGGNMTDLKGQTIDYAGKDLHVKNEGGVLASLTRHKEFLQKLQIVDLS